MLRSQAPLPCRPAGPRQSSQAVTEKLIGRAVQKLGASQGAGGARLKMP